MTPIDPDFDLFRNSDTEGCDAEELRRRPPPPSSDTAASWEDITANRACKEVLRSLVTYPKPGRHILIHGPNRSGKTTMIHLALKAKFCLNRRPSLDPCQTCRNCLYWDNGGRARFGHYRNIDGQEFKYYAVDGTNPATFDEEQVCFYRDRSSPLVVYVDEVSHPEFVKFMPRLIKPMTETPMTVIASGVRLSPRKDPVTGAKSPGLSKDFVYRFTAIERTSSPEPGTFLGWLRRRAAELNLTPDDATLLRVIEKAGEIPGQALRPLWKADFMRVPLTREFVEQCRFEVG